MNGTRRTRVANKYLRRNGSQEGRKESILLNHIYCPWSNISILRMQKKKTMEKNGKNSKLKISNKNTKTEEKKSRDSTQKT
mmetsp:Transcript_11677/g.18857  ORF Transcript_11677/g.18857 Transcript_11677/m.18857 type:complete len:81 (+) Transcript_11677:382-624(+)